MWRQNDDRRADLILRILGYGKRAGAIGEQPSPVDAPIPLLHNALGRACRPPGDQEPFRSFTKKYPKITTAYEAMGEAVREAGPLNEREVALVKLALSLGSRLEGATHAHGRRALALGIEPDALRHVAILSSPAVGFPSMMAAYN
jgi:4-carboxymuconolactone decarboxylase